MSEASALLDLRVDAEDWFFSDLRIDIPPASFGSDAINPHTQYSNPIALMGDIGVGASFTLGAGNEMVCAAAALIVSQLDGTTVGELVEAGFHKVVTNPRQLRWLSPNAGVPLMAAGLIVNTLLDHAAKSQGLAAWEYLARLPTEVLLSLVDLSSFADDTIPDRARDVLDAGLEGIDGRCRNLRESGLPVYFTTWIGHSPEAIADQIVQQVDERGISRFKLKVGNDMEGDLSRLQQVRDLAPTHIELCVDANQTLSMSQAKNWLSLLSDQGFTWLEEPFAPDNVAAFEALCDYRRTRELTAEVVTGENCPNTHTAQALIEAGINRLQSDPCRMFGLVDTVTTSVLAYLSGCEVTPHAGGSGLDELSPHIQLFNLARVTGSAASDSLTENVGFSSRFFAAPTVVSEGEARVQTEPGFIVGLEESVVGRLVDYREGVTWLEL